MAAEQVAALDFRMQEEQSQIAVMLMEAQKQLACKQQRIEMLQVAHRDMESALNVPMSPGHDASVVLMQLEQTNSLLEVGEMTSSVDHQELAAAKGAVDGAVRSTEAHLTQAAQEANELQLTSDKVAGAAQDYQQAVMAQQAHGTQAANLIAQLQFVEHQIASCERIKLTSNRHIHNVDHTRSLLLHELASRAEEHESMCKQFLQTATVERTRADEAARMSQVLQDELRTAREQLIRVQQSHESSNVPHSRMLTEMKVQCRLIQVQASMVAEEKSHLESQARGQPDQEDAIAKIEAVATWQAVAAEQILQLAKAAQEMEKGLSKRTEAQMIAEAEYEGTLIQATAEHNTHHSEAQLAMELWKQKDGDEGARQQVFDQYKEAMQGKLAQLDLESAKVKQSSKMPSETRDESEQSLRQRCEQLRPAIAEAEAEQMQWKRREQQAQQTHQLQQMEVATRQSAAAFATEQLERALEAEHRLRMQVEDVESRNANKVWNPIVHDADRQYLLETKAQLEAALEHTKLKEEFSRERIGVQQQLDVTSSEMAVLHEQHAEEQARVTELKQLSEREAAPGQHQLAQQLAGLGEAQTNFENDKLRINSHITALQQQMGDINNHVAAQEAEISTLAQALREGMWLYTPAAKALPDETNKLNKVWQKAQRLIGDHSPTWQVYQ